MPPPPVFSLVFLGTFQAVTLPQSPPVGPLLPSRAQPSPPSPILGAGPGVCVLRSAELRLPGPLGRPRVLGSEVSRPGRQLTWGGDRLRGAPCRADGVPYLQPALLHGRQEEQRPGGPCGGVSALLPAWAGGPSSLGAGAMHAGRAAAGEGPSWWTP